MLPRSSLPGSSHILWALPRRAKNPAGWWWWWGGGVLSLQQFYDTLAARLLTAKLGKKQLKKKPSSARLNSVRLAISSTSFLEVRNTVCASVSEWRNRKTSAPPPRLNTRNSLLNTKSVAWKHKFVADKHWQPTSKLWYIYLIIISFLHMYF